MEVRHDHHLHRSHPRPGCTDRRRWGALRQLIYFRSRNASTALSNASFASIIVQWPQLGNTCNSALGMVRIGSSAISSGLTRSSRPQVINVGDWTRYIAAHGCGPFDDSMAFII